MNDPRHAARLSRRASASRSPRADVASYRRAADFLNVNARRRRVACSTSTASSAARPAATCCALLRELRMPIVTTLHTILARAEPAAAPRDRRARASSPQRLVVMSSARRRRCCTTCYGVPPDEDRRHSARHSRACRRRASSKDRLGVEGTSVLLTFGLLSPDKGIEYVIDALPAIVARHPDAVYIVLGATHPHVKEQHGETYRLMLEARARQLGVDEHVIFHDRFVEPGRADRVPRRRRHLHHAVPEPGADHVGHARLRGRLGQGRDLDAVRVRARAARRRSRRARAVARRRGDRARGRRPARRRRAARRAARARRSARAQR